MPQQIQAVDISGSNHNGNHTQIYFQHHPFVAKLFLHTTQI
jgi:hypothetical protein